MRTLWLGLALVAANLAAQTPDYLSAGDAGEAIRLHIISSPGWVPVKRNQTDMSAPRYAALDLVTKVSVIQAHEATKPFASKAR